MMQDFRTQGNMTPDFRTHLLARLDAIGVALAATGRGVALIGLGSVGTELGRIDEYSDLDFFAVVTPGSKQALLDDLGWLTAIHPVAYAFRNTADGYKLLYADGVFCEFAIFEAAELAAIPFAPGRIVWQAADAPAGLEAPQQAAPTGAARSVEWLVGEALTNLYVGLGRDRRGERLSAMRFIQGYAVDRVLELAALLAAPTGAPGDIFSVERRAEQRHPSLAPHLADFAQGYARNSASALAILAWIETHFPVNLAIRAAILERAAAPQP